MTNCSNDEKNFLDKLNSSVEANLFKEEFGVSELCSDLNISRATLYRKIKATLNKSATGFIRQKRLEKAFELLQKNEGNISEIAYKVGFGSIQYFNKSFRHEYGLTPGEVLKSNYSLNEYQKPESTKTKFLQKWHVVISLVIALIFLFLYFSLLNSCNNDKEKSIAVLPPIDISPDDNNCKILEGFREYLHIKLNAIDDFKVISSTSTETYRNSKKKAKQIANELNVNYLIEIHGQEVNDKTLIFVQLIDAKSDVHIWSQPYQHEIGLNNFFNVQEDVANLVARSLKTAISINENDIIAKIPTKNLPALESYNYGINELQNSNYSGRKEDFLHAKKLFEKAIQFDSTFADAYLKLGGIYITKLSTTATINNPNRELYENYLDTGLQLINKAIQLDVSDLEEALLVKSKYYQYTNQHDIALEILDEIWQRRKKTYKYFEQKGNYYYKKGDYYNSLSCYFKYYRLKPETVIPDKTVISRTAIQLSQMDFIHTAEDFAFRLYEQHGDSIKHNYFLKLLYGYAGDNEKLEEILINELKKDSTNLSILAYLGYAQIGLHKYKESYSRHGLIDSLEKKNYKRRIADVFHGYVIQVMEGDTAKANWHYRNAARTVLNEIKNQVTPFVQSYSAYYYLAACYSCLNNKTDAIKSLNYLNDIEYLSKQFIVHINEYEVFNNIRNEPDFIALLNQLELKFNTNRERIKNLIISAGYEPS